MKEISACKDFVSTFPVVSSYKQLPSWLYSVLELTWFVSLEFEAIFQYLSQKLQLFVFCDMPAAGCANMTNGAARQRSAL